jgi:hypothetical protein
MTPREVTADHLRAIEKAIGIPCERWTSLHATSIVAAAVNMADTLKPPAPKPDEPELSDEDAHAKFVALIVAQSTDERFPSLDEAAQRVVRVRHPKLAAQYDRHEAAYAEAAQRRALTYRGRFAHR